MTTAAEILRELESLGSEQTRKTFQRHGAPPEMYGVKVADLKKIVKRIRGNQALALDLYATGNSDAMYLAGLVADGALMSKKLLETWAKTATWQMISEYTVPWVASDHPAARELALKWIDARQPHIASSGWSTYAALVATRPDDELDLEEIEALLRRIAKTIHAAPNRVRYTMNGFLIAVGGYVKPLTKLAKSLARQIGPVQVDMGKTSCEVPDAAGYIRKMEARQVIGKKRKEIRC